MTLPSLDSDFWNERYMSGETGWDVGAPSRPLKEFIDTLADKDVRILIPGCGNGYEAAYLHRFGFNDVTVLDIAPMAVRLFKERVSDFPAEKVICRDFFAHSGTYDLILEQTFFCALNPSLRSAYAKKMHQLLRPEGKLAGVWFGVPMNADRPPFGGSREEYLRYFAPFFHVKRMDECTNSIPPRMGSELWAELIRKS